MTLAWAAEPSVTVVSSKITWEILVHLPAARAHCSGAGQGGGRWRKSSPQNVQVVSWPRAMETIDLWFVQPSLENQGVEPSSSAALCLGAAPTFHFLVSSLKLPSGCLLLLLLFTSSTSFLAKLKPVGQKQYCAHSSSVPERDYF